MVLPKEGTHVWAKTAADDTACYVAGKFVKAAGAKVVVERDSDGSSVELDPADMLEVNPGPAVPDLTTMVVLNAATMLHNVRERYEKDKIYTRASNMLVAVNPGHPLPELYTEGTRSKSKNANLHDPRLEPHLYDVAEQAFRQLKAEKKAQSIVISGESGAGKTESIKYCMNYLVWRSDSGVGGGSSSGGDGKAATGLGAVPGAMPGAAAASGGNAGALTNRIMQSNPLLEAIGCAKTQRNHNSSRFGKYITLQFAGSQQIVGAQIHTFLLEKSRVTSTDAHDERSYHVLYYLVAGSPQTQGKGVEAFRMLTQSGTTTIPGVDDRAEFQKLQVALGWFGIESSVQDGLWEVLLGALHLGNVTFSGKDDDDARVADECAKDLAECERLLGMTGLRLEHELVEKDIAAGAEQMTLKLKPVQAMHARDALVKQLYARVFDHLVHCINSALTTSVAYDATIGLLDVFGFETFKRNSFEQLCINYANERLHSFFMDQVFTDEIALYQREGLPVPENVNPPNNAEVCAIFDSASKTHVGAFQLLDSQSRQAKASDTAFCREMYANHEGNAYFGKADSHLLASNKLTTEEAFVVHHFAADVCYVATGFLDKNDSKLSDSFEKKLRQSKQPFIKAVIWSETHSVGSDGDGAASAAAAGSASKMAPPPALPGSSGFSSVGKTFLNDLRKLMRELQATQPHFVRCLKPNPKLQPRVLDGQMIMVQMASSGLIEAVKLMQASYPSRSTYEELLRVFGNQLPKSTQSMPQAHQVEILLYGTTAEPHEYLLGKHLVFFTREAGRVLDELRSTPASMIRPRIVARLEQKSQALTPDEQALLTQLKELIQQEIRDRARRRVTAAAIAVVVLVRLRGRARRSQEKKKRASTMIESIFRGNIGRIEGRKRRAKREAERRAKEEEQREAKAEAEAQARAAADAAAAAAAEAEAAEAAAAEALALAEAEAEAELAAAAAAEEAAAAEAEAALALAEAAEAEATESAAAAEAAAAAEVAAAAVEADATDGARVGKRKPIGSGAAKAEQLAATARGARERAATAQEAALRTQEQADVIKVEEANPTMIDVNGIRCYQAIICSGGTGIFQRHNFEGMWTLAEHEEISGGHPHYEHRTPNGQVVHLFHVNSAYGGAPRWVIGPVPGNENGWGFVDTTATHPELIAEKWMVWMETSWEESKRLNFRGLESGPNGDWAAIVDDDDDEEDEEDDGTAPATQEKKKKKVKKAPAKGKTPAKKKKAAGGGTPAKSGAKPKKK